MRPRPRRIAFLLAVTCVAGSTREAPAQRPPIDTTWTAAHTRLVGCYALHLGRWSGPFPSGWPAAHQPPKRIELDSAFWQPIESWRGARMLRPNLAVFSPDRIPPGWWVRPDSTVVLRWSNGFVGTQLELHQQQAQLVGQAEAFWDAKGPPQPTASVVAERVACRR
jgi:hypothetical protein